MSIHNHLQSVRRPARRKRLPLAFAAVLGSIAASVCCSQAQPVTAEQILAATGVRGGFVVHLGCGDGKLTAALHASEGYTVQGLEPDPAKVNAARDFIRRTGLYGPVSVEQFAGAALPYADNLINLVVAEHRGAVSREEILRVLVPNGVAYLSEGGEWQKLVKPRPANIDDWSHFLHDAGNNAVAEDTVVGPPRALQWIAPPLWLRSHETPSGIEGLVTSGGRLFYYFDEGVIGITDQRLPERWSLICRDAFNGKLLWKRPVAKWGWSEWAADRFGGIDWTDITGGRTVVPDENQRRLVAIGDRLYATLSYAAPLSILDAATGEVRTTVEATAPVREIVSVDGVVVVFAGGGMPGSAKRRGEGEAEPASLIAVNGDSGEVLWKTTTAPIKSLFLAVAGGRVVYQTGPNLVGLDLKTGQQLWRVAPNIRNGRTLVVHDGVAVILGGKGLEARDARTGEQLWQKDVLLASGLGSEDLFIAEGLVWPAILSVDEKQQPKGKSPDALAVGYDLRTGEERKRLFVPNLRSPEHHHRCYRNKATDRFLISAMEGAEFLDLKGDGHDQNNWLRGACKFGVMPANGMLYVPTDQCFCEPGAKLLGFAAVGSQPVSPATFTPNSKRLQKGPAYADSRNPKPGTPDLKPADWPTFRHDAARHGTTPASVAPQVKPRWRTKLGGGLTQPVAVGDRVYVASRDAHTVHALDMKSGGPIWTFVAGGRIDSPPTYYRALLLVGSADGYVYCLRAADGALAWRFLAAPVDRRIAYFDQFESVWPVHGSVLIREGVAYFTAGRSTYLDGGIRLYGLDPLTGKLLHVGKLEGPFPDGKANRDYSFYVLGANSDILVSEGGALYMRQKKLTPALEEVKAEVLSTKGEQDVGSHVFSTSGLLDDSWYNRTFWMYSKRWPGFQLANQAPKSGQLLVVDRQNTYAVHPFYHRNVHSPMFFPGKEGYPLFADRNTTEPQIVGEEGARTPVEWLPQSSYGRKEGPRTLDSPAFGLDKMIGYTRAEPPLWMTWFPVRMRAMVKAGDTLFVAGPPDEFDPEDPLAPFEGRRGAQLIAVAAKDGKRLTDRPLDVPPVFDGMVAVTGRLLVSLEDGSLACFGG